MALFRNDPTWIVFDEKPVDGYSPNLPGGTSMWTGPFFVDDPHRKQLVAVFGRSATIEASQRQFEAMFYKR